MTTAPPQTPAAQAQARALVAAAPKPEVAQDVRLVSIAGREGVERFETVVTIPADYQYRIPIKGVKHPDGSWNNDAAKVGLLSDAYDYLNRVIGVSFFIPPEVHDETGTMCPNPIHRGDLTLLRLGAVWYNPMGQLVMAVEDVKVDFQTMWMEKRVNMDSAAIVRDERGQMLFDEYGNPVLVLNDADEKAALKDLYHNRSNGLRYTYTVARTRLLKLATGIRSLPLNYPADFRMRVVGFRDYMTPQERIEQVAGDAAHLFGTAPDIEPLTSAEMGEAADIAERAEADEATEVQTAQAEPKAATQAAVASAICGMEEPEVTGSFCMVTLEPDGKHPAGPHRYSSGGVGPQ